MFHIKTLISKHNSININKVEPRTALLKVLDLAADMNLRCLDWLWNAIRTLNKVSKEHF
jgi:hypothetical protein